MAGLDVQVLIDDFGCELVRHDFGCACVRLYRSRLNFPKLYILMATTLEMADRSMDHDISDEEAGAPHRTTNVTTDEVLAKEMVSEVLDLFMMRVGPAPNLPAPFTSPNS